MSKPGSGEVKLVKKKSPLSTPKKQTKLSKPAKKATPTKIVKAVVKKSVKKETPNLKKIVKGLKVRSFTDDVRKIQILENITKREIPPPPVKKTLTIPISHRVKLAAASYLAVPIDHASLVSNMARYAGTAFVVVGAFLTLYTMNSSFAVLNDEALMVAQTTTSTTCLTGSDCGGTTQNTKPNPDIKVESSGSVLVGTVPVNATVSFASRIDLVARNTVTNTTSAIGTMMRISDLAWRSYWQTASLDDGTYRIKAIIVNQYGTYSYENSTEYTIQNHPIDTVTTTQTEEVSTTQTAPTAADSTTATSSGATDGGTTATTSATTTVTAPTTLASSTLPNVRIEVGSSEPLIKTVMLKTYVEGASNVRMYVRPSHTTTSSLLGYATLYGAGEWRFGWDTTRLQDGDYDIRAQAIFPNGTSNSRTIEGLTVLNASSATTPSSTVATPTTTTNTTDAAALEPNVKLILSQSNPLEKIVDTYVTGNGLSAVELFVLPSGSLTPRFLGNAVKQSDTGWRYRFDTTLLPNGQYELYAHVRTQYGESNSSRTTVRIENELVDTATSEEKEYLTALKDVGTEVLPQTGEGAVENVSTPYEELVSSVDEEYQDKMDTLLQDFREKLDQIMSAYGKAIRANDTEAVRQQQNALEQLRNDAIAQLPFGPGKEETITRINENLGSIIKDLRERVERTETLIRDRVGDEVTKDTDLDGISDYDEVNLYKTDALAADTDQDGYTDGIEVLNGYDPLNSERESNVQYESPRDQGVVREDLLTIDHVTTIAQPTNNEPLQAHMGGKALPNSFVTLYIFSTPLVVTVKADRDGNWSYIFDKELEDGEHEVYVGITDNAGKLVAKSNPFPFVKTAEAYAPVTKEANALVSVSTDEPALISQSAFLIIGSLAVVSLGLVLILLGLHVRPREELPLPILQ